MWKYYLIGGLAATGLTVTARVIWPNIRPKVFGFLGEAKVRRILNSYKSKDYAAAHDILMKGGRDTTQVDHVLISRHGIFVIETKNYSGQIFGSEHLRNWIQRLPGRKAKDIPFLNPIFQNMGHVNAIRALLHRYPGVPIHSIVAFGNRCSIPAIPGVVKIRDLKLAIKARSLGKPVLTEEQVQDIRTLLSTAAIESHSAREQHDLKAKLSSDAARHVTPEMMHDLAAKAKTSELLHFEEKAPEPAQAPQQIALTDTGAMLTIRTRTASIEDFFESAKRDQFNHCVPKGANFNHFICPYTGDSFPISEAMNFYRGLWIAYLNKHPDLVEYLQAHISEQPGNHFRCQKVLSDYTENPQYFIAQTRSSLWYQNVVKRHQQKKRSLNTRIQGAEHRKSPDPNPQKSTQNRREL